MNLVGCLPPWFTSRKEKICQSEFKVSSAVRDQLELEFYDLISDREIVMKKKCLKPCQKMIIKVCSTVLIFISDWQIYKMNSSHL